VKIFIATPQPPGSTLGNAITANRWAKILRQLGHEVTLAMQWVRGSEKCDVLIALHARRSYPSIQQFRQADPVRPLIVVLTGTDLYGDLPAGDLDALESLDLATRIIVLQEGACEELPEKVRSRIAVIYQSAVAPSNPRQPQEDCFEVCVLSHLRDVKDPLRAAHAARRLHSESRVRILHAGRALSSDWEAKAREEEEINLRYQWLGDRPHDEAMQLLSGSRLLVLSSLMEGGASVIAEAVVCGVPVLCSKIRGNIGMLGPDYPGYFPPGDHAELRELLRRAETERRFLEALRNGVLALQSRFAPEAERASWSQLLAGLL
jgi:putative glycosyltransferase (TIGR04348 family)